MFHLFRILFLHTKTEANNHKDRQLQTLKKRKKIKESGLKVLTSGLERI